MRNVVQRLEGHAVGERRVAKDADDVLARAALIASGAHAERRGKGGAGVARAKAIVFALGAEREAVQSVRGADGVKAVLAPGENLVDVGLVADIPDKLVLRRGENTVERDGHLDDAEVRAEVSAVLRQLHDQLVPDFFGELLLLFKRQFLDVFGAVHHVEVTAHRSIHYLGSCHRLAGAPARPPHSFQVC